MTFVKVRVKNPEKPTRFMEGEFLVDSGAIYSVVPGETLKRLGIEPHRTQAFTLADGTKVERKVGDAIYELNGARGAAPIIFGKKGDSLLLGAFTLEALGLVLDPFQRKLRPMKLFLV